MKSSNCRKVSFLIGPLCQFLDEDQSLNMTELFLWYPLFRVKCDTDHKCGHQAMNYSVKYI